MLTLQESCVTYFSDQLTTHSALELWHMAHDLQCGSLAVKVKTFILANFTEIFCDAQQDFVCLEVEKLEELLCDDNLRVPDEDFVAQVTILVFIQRKFPIGFSLFV